MLSVLEVNENSHLHQRSLFTLTLCPFFFFLCHNLLNIEVFLYKFL